MNSKLFLIFLFVIGFISQPNISHAEMAKDISAAQQNLCNILNTNDMNAAKSVEDKLISDFAAYKDLPEAIHWTIRHCEWTGKYDEAKKLYQILIDKYPTSQFSNNSTLGITRVNIMQMIMSLNYETAKNNINKMIVDFSKNTELPESLLMIAEKLEWQRQFEDEKDVFQIIIKDYTAGAFSDKAKIGIARADILSYIVAGDDLKFNDSMDKLFINFANNQGLADTAIIIGEWFNKEGLKKEKEGSIEESKVQFEKALKIWDRVINELPNSELIPEACCWAGDCYYKLSRYEESLQRFQQVVDNHLGYKYSWHALFMVGRNYEGMRDSGLISKTTANSQIASVYKQIIEKYPTCPVIETVKTWVDTSNMGTIK